VTLGADGEGAATVIRAVEVRLVSARDKAEEAARVGRELAEAKELLERSRELLAKRGFADKAPQDVIDREKARLKEREERVRLLEGRAKR
jgi:valyl-tRNA synthetase